MANDYDYLIPGLAQGSVPPSGVQLPFDVVVLAAYECQPEPSVPTIFRAALDDSGPPPNHIDKIVIRETAKEVARRVRAGQRVLVTCRQGRNRSGVISGLALVELGMSGRQAAELIRRIRNGLTNPYFYEMVIGS